MVKRAIAGGDILKIRRGLYALAQAGPWKGAGPSVDYSWCFEALRNKIETTDWHSAAEDVRWALRAEI